MKLVCPICHSDVPREEVDMSSESAFCIHCQKDFEYKGWIESMLSAPENLRHPPTGASYKQTAKGFKVAVSTRSYRWLFFLPVAALWTLLMLFLSWGFFHADSSTRWILYLCLTPLYLFGVALWCGALMPMFGKVKVQVEGESGIIFKGIGSLGWSQRFDWQTVKRIQLTTYGMVNRNLEQITLEGDHVIHLARGVGHERLRFLLIALRQNHHKNSPQNKILNKTIEVS